jgi:HSP20 family protein
LHKLFTLCSIDFELRHTFAHHWPPFVDIQASPLKCKAATQFQGHARNFEITELGIDALNSIIYLGVSVMTVIRYEPWALVSRLQKDIDRVFGAPPTTAADSGAWLPPVDIHEEANQFALHVDLPGVDPKAVEITADQGVLTIRGQRDDARRESRDGYRRVERITGEFQRRFSLPDSADAQNIKAKFVNGVLEVAIPKLAQVQPHRITVEAA